MEESDDNKGRLIEDLLLEIFKRLPVETLVRFQSVCKWWKSLLSSSSLIKRHHSLTSSSTPASLKPYLRRTSDPKSYAIRRPQETDPLIDHPLHFPFKFFSCYTRHYPDFTFVVLKGRNQELNFGWDRFTLPNELVTGMIRTWPRTYGMSAIYAIGFGYDTCRDDFKVVRIWIPNSDVEEECPGLKPTYEVYSDREGRWRMGSMDDIDLYAFQLDCGRSPFCHTSCFVNGTIHWLLSSYSGYIDEDKEYMATHLVLMFDCESEEFTTMELPEEIYQSPPGACYVKTSLLEYGGMLCALTCPPSYSEPLDAHFVLWAMEEHGVASSWKKVYRISYTRDLDLKDIDIYQPSFAKLVAQWVKIYLKEKVLSCHVYEETLFLMDHNQAQSYAKDETIDKIIPSRS